MMINPRPAEATPSAHDTVYRGLRTRIMYGEIAPGSALTLRGIGKEYGVSMTPAREAVRRLVAEGALFLSASGRVSTPELTSERIEELAALRALLEVELASRALPRAHIALIDRMQSIDAVIAEAASNRLGWVHTGQSGFSPYPVPESSGPRDIGHGRNRLAAIRPHDAGALCAFAPHRTATFSSSDPCSAQSG